MEDLQSLLEKINRDGVEKAEAEAKKIVDAAKARASAVMAEAEAAAAKMREDAERDTAAYVARAEESLRQVLTAEEYAAIMESGDYEVKFKWLSFLGK